MTRRARGYTLMEMMVAVAIVAIIGMIAIPVSSRLRERSYLNSAVREFSAKITQARSLAASSQGNPAWPPDARVRSAGIRFASPTQYTVFIDRDMTVNGDEIDVVIVDLNEGRRDNMVTIVAPATPARLRFNNSSTLIDGATVDVSFRDSAEHSSPKTVRVSLSGIPKIMN